MDRPLRLVVANPLDRLARTVEALLVVASQPLSVEELAAAADDNAERVETALGLLAERYREGRSGIVLEQVAGGWAFRAAREAAAACGRLVERPVERFLARFRAVLRTRRRFDLERELAGLTRLEQASAFLAVLELRKANELVIEQAAPFAPIRISRTDVEQEVPWRTRRYA